MYARLTLGSQDSNPTQCNFCILINFYTFNAILIPISKRMQYEFHAIDFQNANHFPNSKNVQNMQLNRVDSATQASWLNNANIAPPFSFFFKTYKDHISLNSYPNHMGFVPTDSSPWGESNGIFFTSIQGLCWKWCTSKVRPPKLHFA